MAEVFRATEPGLDGFEREVAIKRILPHIAADPRFRTMFRDEAKLVVQLKHGNIAQVYHLGEESGTFYMALEYVDGVDLRVVYERCRELGTPFPISLACYVMARVCEGLDYAHCKVQQDGRPLELIHRDVSPPNIIVSYEGEVKLIDFGLAKAATVNQDTERGILKGKLAYLSPEQARGEPLDGRSDIFSAGIVLWEMLTGERLFLGEDDIDTFTRVQQLEIPLASAINPRIPWRLERILRRALNPDRDHRYQTAEAMHDELRHFMLTANIALRGDRLAEWMREHVPRRRPRRV
jgi:serine/threonine-protein kinase